MLSLAIIKRLCIVIYANSHSSNDCQKGNLFAPEPKEHVNYVGGIMATIFSKGKSTTHIPIHIILDGGITPISLGEVIMHRNKHLPDFNNLFKKIRGELMLVIVSLIVY